MHRRVVLTAAAKAQQTLNYSEIGGIIHRHHRAARHVLSPLRDFCLQMRLPPLTAIVISKGNHLPGNGFIAHSIDDIETAFEEVFGFDWSSVPIHSKDLGPTTQRRRSPLDSSTNQKAPKMSTLA